MCKEHTEGKIFLKTAFGISSANVILSRDYDKKSFSLHFDVCSARSVCLQTDKFVLISDVWNRFVDNCVSCYKPVTNITNR